MKFFIFDNSNNRINVNEPEILLIKEFKDIWESKRNITKTDKTGEQKTLAFRELTFIYLMLDWQSPYSDYYEQDRYNASLIDSGLSQEEYDDPLFRAACRKYRAIQDENMALKCLQAAKGTIHKFIDYFTDIDPQERDQETGKPIYKVKDIMSELTKLNELFESFKALEYQVKKEKEQESSNRAGEVDGFQPNFNQ